MDTKQQATQIGKMIVVDGIEGAGKSTVIAHIHHFLKDKDIDVVLTREPGGTAFGETLRELLKASTQPSLQPLSELLLLYASRHELLSQLVLPALKAGKWVLSDRFELSTFAYQGAGRGLPQTQIVQLSDWCLQGFKPDLTFYLDISYEMSVKRLAHRGGNKDRFEQEGKAFFERVRTCYRDIADRCSDVHLIDAESSVEAIHQQMNHHLTGLLS